MAPPTIISSIGGKLRIPNLTNQPLTLKKSEQFCQIRHAVVQPDPPESPQHHEDASRVPPTVPQRDINPS